MIQIVELRAENRAYAVAFMAGLQEHERQISSDRRPGKEMADAHLAYLEKTCRVNSGKIFLARINQAYAGFIVCFINRYEPDDLHITAALKTYGEISDLYVAPQYRGQGVASSLIRHAETYLAALGQTRVKLTVLNANASAQRAYETLGYAPYEVIYQKELA